MRETEGEKCPEEEVGERGSGVREREGGEVEHKEKVKGSGQVEESEKEGGSDVWIVTLTDRVIFRWFFSARVRKSQRIDYCNNRDGGRIETLIGDYSSSTCITPR